MALTYRGRDDQKRDRFGNNQHRTAEQLIATAYGQGWLEMRVFDGDTEIAWYRKLKNGKIKYGLVKEVRS